LRGAESTAQELQRTLQKKTADHDKTVANLQSQIEALKENQKQESVDDRVSKRTKDERLNMRSDSYSKPLPSLEPHIWESQIEVYSPPIVPSFESPRLSNISRSDTPSKSLRPRSSHSALSEIVNVQRRQCTAPRYGSRPTPPTLPALQSRSHYPILQHAFLESPEMQLPSPEPSLLQITSRAIHDRNCPRKSSTINV